MKTWKCVICGYIYEGDEPPNVCPVCQYGADKFIEVANYTKKKKFKKPDSIK